MTLLDLRGAGGGAAEHLEPRRTGRSCSDLMKALNLPGVSVDF